MGSLIESLEKEILGDYRILLQGSWNSSTLNEKLLKRSTVVMETLRKELGLKSQVEIDLEMLTLVMSSVSEMKDESLYHIVSSLAGLRFGELSKLKKETIRKVIHLEFQFENSNTFHCDSKVLM